MNIFWANESDHFHCFREPIFLTGYYTITPEKFVCCGEVYKHTCIRCATSKTRLFFDWIRGCFGKEREREQAGRYISFLINIYLRAILLSSCVNSHKKIDYAKREFFVVVYIQILETERRRNKDDGGKGGFLRATGWSWGFTRQKKKPNKEGKGDRHWGKKRSKTTPSIVCFNCDYDGIGCFILSIRGQFFFYLIFIFITYEKKCTPREITTTPSGRGAEDWAGLSGHWPLHTKQTKIKAREPEIDKQTKNKLGFLKIWLWTWQGCKGEMDIRTYIH